MAMGKVRLYACGGLGANIGASYLGASREAIAAEIHPVFFDTSRSNLDKRIGEDMCYLIPDVDGSGKRRGENYERIKDVVKDVLHKHKPLDLNIVLCSGSGGSGSVAAPLITGELISRGAMTIVIMVGGDESTQAAKNTLQTLQSFEGISKAHNKTVVMHYRHNIRGQARSKTDKEIHYAISMLAVLASGKISKIDTMDMVNWINFEKVTVVTPRLAALEIFATDAPWGDYSPISVMSIYKDSDQETLPIVPEYQCSGYADIMGLDAIHYLIDVSVVPKFAQRINATLKELDEERKSRPNITSIISDKVKPDDSGMVID